MTVATQYAFGHVLSHLYLHEDEQNVAFPESTLNAGHDGLVLSAILGEIALKGSKLEEYELSEISRDLRGHFGNQTDEDQVRSVELRTAYQAITIQMSPQSTGYSEACAAIAAGDAEYAICKDTTFENYLAPKWRFVSAGSAL